MKVTRMTGHAQLWAPTRQCDMCEGRQIGDCAGVCAPPHDTAAGTQVLDSAATATAGRVARFICQPRLAGVG